MPPPTSARDDLLQAGPLLWRTGGLLLTMFLGVVAVGWLLRGPILAVSCGFVERFGPWGIALGFFLPDATNLPIPHDLFLMMGAAAGLPVWQIILAASLGSLCGGSLAYGMSALVRRHSWVQARLAARSGAVTRVVERYGAVAVAVGALTPLPYSLLAWAAGLLQVRFRVFFLVSLLRFVRVSLYFALIRLGLNASGLTSGCALPDPEPPPLTVPEVP